MYIAVYLNTKTIETINGSEKHLVEWLLKSETPNMVIKCDNSFTNVEWIEGVTDLSGKVFVNIFDNDNEFSFKTELAATEELNDCYDDQFECVSNYVSTLIIDFDTDTASFYDYVTQDYLEIMRENRKASNNQAYLTAADLGV
jgi:hypothetical protein